MQGAGTQVLEPDEVMGNGHHRQALFAAQVLQQPQQAALAGGIQSGQRLVEDQRPRFARQHSGQHHAPHLAAAELVDAALGQGGVQPHGPQRSYHAVLVLR